MYWFGDVNAVRQFVKADKMRQERMNQEAWWQGRYFFDAVSVAIANMGLKKGQTPFEYLKEPYKVSKEERKRETDEEKEKRENQEAVFARAYMLSMVRAGKNWGKNK